MTRFSTPEVLQAAGAAARHVRGLAPISVTAALCGPAATCACAPGDNLAVHRLLARASAGSVLVVAAGGRTDCGHFGELAALDAVNRGLEGLVLDGAIRDARALAELGFPVFHGGVAPAGAVKERVLSLDEPVTIRGVTIAPGDQLVADGDAILVVPAAAWPAVAAGAQQLREVENGIRGRLHEGARLAELLDLPGMTALASRIGVDVGGTFTDVILYGGDGRVTLRKLLSTPPSYDQAVVEAVGALAAGSVAEVVHGTTVATNAVLERRGSPTALVTTAGFRDVLELRRLRIPHMYDLFWRKPPPLVERHLRFELNERVAADGTVVRALDEEESRTLAARLRATGVESVAVCFLHSYLYPEHEQRFGAILAEELPGASVSLSSEILREQREYERSATTVVNAYVRPLMASYIDRIRIGLDGIGIDGPLQIMQSSGGVMTADDAKDRPVFALESGPAAGVVAAQGMGQRLGIGNLLAFDMGGTTAKASLIEDGAISRGREYEVGGSMSAGSRLIRGAGELLRIPTIDIAEVGAGGGSIAWIDPAGGLQVGPRSAGADPGPACYGRGGIEPTVTDANVVLGYMPAVTVADGQVSISAELAEHAVRRVAEPLGLTILEAASGIHRIANARMTRALRAVSSEKGRDPRDFALIAYGGAGPIHAAGLAEGLGMRTVLVPVVAGLFSAVGLLFARPEFHEVRTCHLDVDVVDPAAVAALFAMMETRLVRTLEGRSEIEWVRTADLRYGGQSWEVEVGFPAGGVDAGVLAALRGRFEDEHGRLYGVKDQAGSPVEIRALRLAALGEAPPMRSFHLDGANAAGAGASSRRIQAGGTDVDAPVRTRSSFGESPEPGPLLVDEYDTTVVVPQGWSARRDPATGTLVLERGVDGD